MSESTDELRELSFLMLDGFRDSTILCDKYAFIVTMAKELSQPLIGGNPAADTGCLDSNKSTFRYTLLLCNCLLTFGSYYCFDMPTVLENYIEDQVVAGFTTSVSTYYTLFYTIYAWTNMLMSLVAGVLVDKYGTRFSMFLFLGLCLIGSALFALGASLTGSTGSTRYIIMFAGRFIFGLGGGSITVVQNAITAKWFKGREMAFAFGCTLTISRIGSVINYDVTSLIYEKAEDAQPGFGLGITLWVGSALVALSYLAAFCIVCLENKATAQVQYQALAGEDEETANVTGTAASNGNIIQEEDTKVPPATPSTSYVEDIKAMPATFWVVCLIITFFYNLVFPWQAIAVDYIKTSYGVHPNEWASWRASMVYMVSMIVSPFLGAAVDMFGRRDWLAIFGTGLAIPIFLMLGDSSIEPVIPLLMLGCSYSICAAVLWPTLQILVDPKVVGRANGIATSMQMLGIGICNIVVGSLKDANKEPNPLSPPCCALEGNSEACFDTAYTGSCQPSQYNRCGDVSVDGVDYSMSCQSTNYTPMLDFFTAMAIMAVCFAILLKFMDRKDRALYIGHRDKKAAFLKKYDRLPETTDELLEANQLAKEALQSAAGPGAGAGAAAKSPLLNDIS